MALTLALAPSTYAQKPSFQPPKRLNTPGFQAGIFDVGACLVSGQPSEAAFRQLAQEGLKTVICVRTQPELDDRRQVPFDEATLLKELGVRFVHIPLDTYTPLAVARFAEALEKETGGRVLLHCTVAWRASYVWMAYLINHRGVSVDEAWSAGMQMNATPDRIAALLDMPISYTKTPAKPGTRKPPMGLLSKPGAKRTLTAPRLLTPPGDNLTAYALWDLGEVLNAAQPDEKALRALASQGVKTVINLRTPQEMAQVKRGGFDEEAVAKELGMAYISIPIQAAADFSPANLERVAQALEGAQGRVLLHCQSAMRSTPMLVAYLVKYQGVPVQKAYQVGESMRWVTIFQELLGAELSYKLAKKSSDR